MLNTVISIFSTRQHWSIVSIFRFSFNKTTEAEKSTQLDWVKRYQIINGIAQGLEYLHENTELKVVHRDLKAANILLDMDMNPKISDFGIARIFEQDQTQGITNRVVGTK
jgi:serine/threonine protein kinase